jgi:hypothetical protein
MLAPGVGPGSGVRALSPAAQPPAKAGLDKLGFAELLEKARSGEIETSLPVTIDPAVDLEFSTEQLARLAKAADRAEAEGLATALVQLDGKNLTLDVQSRRITGLVPDGGVASGIDGVVIAPVAEGAAGALAGSLDQLASRRSLLKLLDGNGGRPAAAA